VIVSPGAREKRREKYVGLFIPSEDLIVGNILIIPCVEDARENELQSGTKKKGSCSKNSTECEFSSSKFDKATTSFPALLSGRFTVPIRDRFTDTRDE
jgi:hypothetical protein